jgi:hypothetical protein
MKDTIANAVVDVIGNAPPVIKDIPKRVPVTTDLEFWLSLIVLGFGAVIILLEVVLLWRARANVDGILKLIATTLIVVGTIFMITAGFSSEQVAPAIGLMGTLAGYLLGKKMST